MRFEDFITDLKGTTKAAVKEEILEKYDCEELRELLRLAYDSDIKFNVKIDAKMKKALQVGDKDLGEVYEQAMAVLRFCEHSASPKQNKEMVIPFARELSEGSQEFFLGVVSKNLKAGINAKTIIKVFPGLFTQFLVQLANTYSPTTKGHQLPEYHMSYKLDGVRCVMLRKDGEWIAQSRKGKEFLTVDHLKPQLEVLYEEWGCTFFDGELYKHGLLFEEIQGPVMAFTRGQFPGVEYHTFLGGDAENFLSQSNPNNVVLPMIDTEVEGAPQIKFTNRGLIKHEEIYTHLEEAFAQGYEGIMLRDPDMLYDYKRSNAILKLKDSITDEEEGEIISDAVVMDIDYNPEFPVVYENEFGDNVIVSENLLNKLIVQQPDGTICKVGSGFDLSFRRYYTEKPNEIIGKVIEVKHQHWGKNGRMRFPRLFRVREDL